MYHFVGATCAMNDVNIKASQADRELNWTARINKVVDRVTQDEYTFFEPKICHQLVGYLGLYSQICLKQFGIFKFAMDYYF